MNILDLTDEYEETRIVSDESKPSVYFYAYRWSIGSKIKGLDEEKELDEGDYGINVSLLPWIILSKDKKMIIPTDSVLTVVEPVDALTKLYQDKIDSFKMEEVDD